MENIDFVITWVDGNDPEWLQQKNKALGISEGDSREARYRDWETLRYWFRGVEAFAPWVNHIYFVTCGQKPEWLRLDHPKLTLVRHSDFIPSQYLPTFSCRPIEFNLHRIPGLSEQFVYFNDDMFLIRKVYPEDFFRRSLPCDSAILDVISLTGAGRNGEKLGLDEIYTSLVYNTAIINRNFNKKVVLRQNWKKWFSPQYGIAAFRTLLLCPWTLFTGFKSNHLPYSYLKKTYAEVWSRETNILDEACRHTFRSPTDVSSRLLSFWQIAKGDFYPRSPKIGIQTFISNDDQKNQLVFKNINQRKCKMICVNDEYNGTDFESVKKKLCNAFQKILPKKSQFER